MFTDSTGMLILIPALLGIFVLMARIDLYLAKRRSQIAYARYLAMDSNEGRSRLGVGVRITPANNVFELP
jgi:hypothetical protein